MDDVSKSIRLLRDDAIYNGHGDLARLYQLSLIRLAGDEVAKRLAIKREKE